MCRKLLISLLTLSLGFLCCIDTSAAPPLAASNSASAPASVFAEGTQSADAALSEAIERRDINGVSDALKAGADPNRVLDTRGRYTPVGKSVAYLCECGGGDPVDEAPCLRVLHMLFEAGAKYQPRYDDQYLFIPICFGYPKVVALLLSQGADSRTVIDGASLVEWAEANRQDEIVSELVKQGAPPVPPREAAQLRLVQCVMDSDLPGIEKALGAGASLSDKDKLHKTMALGAAMEYPSSEKSLIVDYLLKKGADPNAQDDKWGTPLHRLMFCSTHILSAKAASMPHLQPKRTAALQMADSLLRAGAKVSARNIKEQTPLHIAARWDNCQLAKKLIEAGAKLMDRDGAGKTPLEYAESAEMITLLKASGAKESP